MSPQSVTCICEVIFLQVRPVTGRRQPGAAGDYWEAVTQFVLQGRVDQARNLLRLHSEFTLLDELLRKMPLCSAASSATQFEFSWLAWQVEVSPKSLIEKAFVEH